MKIICESCSCLAHLASTWNMYPLALFSSQSYLNVLSLFDFFSHSKLSAAHFWDILHRYKLFDSKHVGYIDFLYLLESFIYLSFIFTYQWLAWITPPFLSIFLPFVAYQYWLIILILFQAFSIMLAMLILVLLNNEQDKVHMF